MISRHRKYKPVLWVVLITFLINTVVTQPVQADVPFLPKPGQLVSLTPSFSRPTIMGLRVFPRRPFKFEFVMSKGDEASDHPYENPLAQKAFLKEEANKLVKYFLASLTIPEKDLWVNLSPYERDRIVPKEFGMTEMGKELLAQDYLLKQVTASVIYPEGEVGKAFWKKIYQEAYERLGTTSVAVNTFNKVWIVPDKATVYENALDNTVVIVDSKLKVMLEEDYLALKKNTPTDVRHKTVSNQNVGASEVLREIIIPELQKEVNQGQNFAGLRQVYHSLILALWYKHKLKQSLIAQGYVDRKKISRVDVADKSVDQKIYEQYLKSYRKGVYNYIKEETTPDNEIIPRKYFSGGVNWAQVSIKELSGPNAAMIAAGRLKASLSGLFIVKIGLQAIGAMSGKGLGKSSPVLSPSVTNLTSYTTAPAEELKARTTALSTSGKPDMERIQDLDDLFASIVRGEYSTLDPETIRLAVKDLLTWLHESGQKGKIAEYLETYQQILWPAQIHGFMPAFEKPMTPKQNKLAQLRRNMTPEQLLSLEELFDVMQEMYLNLAPLEAINELGLLPVKIQSDIEQTEINQKKANAIAERIVQSREAISKIVESLSWEGDNLLSNKPVSIHVVDQITKENPNLLIKYDTISGYFAIAADALSLPEDVFAQRFQKELRKAFIHMAAEDLEKVLDANSEEDREQLEKKEHLEEKMTSVVARDGSLTEFILYCNMIEKVDFKKASDFLDILIFQGSLGYDKLENYIELKQHRIGRIQGKQTEDAREQEELPSGFKSALASFTAFIRQHPAFAVIPIGIIAGLAAALGGHHGVVFAQGPGPGDLGGEHPGLGQGVNTSHPITLDHVLHLDSSGSEVTSTQTATATPARLGEVPAVPVVSVPAVARTTVEVEGQAVSDILKKNIPGLSKVRLTWTKLKRLIASHHVVVRDKEGKPITIEIKTNEQGVTTSNIDNLGKGEMVEFDVAPYVEGAKPATKPEMAGPRALAVGTALGQAVQVGILGLAQTSSVSFAEVGSLSSRPEMKNLDLEFINRLDLMEFYYGQRLPGFTSTFRTPEQNASIPGAAPNSAHLYGRAADIQTTSYPQQIQLAKAAWQAGLYVENISLTPTHIHVELLKSGSPTALEPEPDEYLFLPTRYSPVPALLMPRTSSTSSGAVARPILQTSRAASTPSLILEQEPIAIKTTTTATAAKLPNEKELLKAKKWQAYTQRRYEKAITGGKLFNITEAAKDLVTVNSDVQLMQFKTQNSSVSIDVPINSNSLDTVSRTAQQRLSQEIAANPQDPANPQRKKVILALTHMRNVANDRAKIGGHLLGAIDSYLQASGELEAQEKKATASLVAQENLQQPIVVPSGEELFKAKKWQADTQRRYEKAITGGKLFNITEAAKDLVTANSDVQLMQFKTRNSSASIDVPINPNSLDTVSRTAQQRLSQEIAANPQDPANPQRKKVILALTHMRNVANDRAKIGGHLLGAIDSYLQASGELEAQEKNATAALVAQEHLQQPIVAGAPPPVEDKLPIMPVSSSTVGIQKIPFDEILERSEINEADPSHGQMLPALISSDVLEDVALSQVRVKPYLSQKKDIVKTMVKDISKGAGRSEADAEADAIKIWNILVAADIRITSDQVVDLRAHSPDTLNGLIAVREGIQHARELLNGHQMVPDEKDRGALEQRELLGKRYTKLMDDLFRKDYYKVIYSIEPGHEFEELRVFKTRDEFRKWYMANKNSLDTLRYYQALYPELGPLNIANLKKPGQSKEITDLTEQEKMTDDGVHYFAYLEGQDGQGPNDGKFKGIITGGLASALDQVKFLQEVRDDRKNNLAIHQIISEPHIQKGTTALTVGGVVKRQDDGLISVLLATKDYFTSDSIGQEIITVGATHKTQLVMTFFYPDGPPKNSQKARRIMLKPYRYNNTPFEVWSFATEEEEAQMQTDNWKIAWETDQFTPQLNPLQRGEIILGDNYRAIEAARLKLMHAQTMRNEQLNDLSEKDAVRRGWWDLFWGPVGYAAQLGSVLFPALQPLQAVRVDAGSDLLYKAIFSKDQLKAFNLLGSPSLNDIAELELGPGLYSSELMAAGLKADDPGFYQKVQEAWDKLSPERKSDFKMQALIIFQSKVPSPEVETLMANLFHYLEVRKAHGVASYVLSILSDGSKEAGALVAQAIFWVSAKNVKTLPDGRRVAGLDRWKQAKYGTLAYSLGNLVPWILTGQVSVTQAVTDATLGHLWSPGGNLDLISALLASVGVNLNLKWAINKLWGNPLDKPFVNDVIAPGISFSFLGFDPMEVNYLIHPEERIQAQLKRIFEGEGVVSQLDILNIAQEANKNPQQLWESLVEAQLVDQYGGLKPDWSDKKEKLVEAVQSNKNLAEKIWAVLGASNKPNHAYLVKDHIIYNRGLGLNEDEIKSLYYKAVAVHLTVSIREAQTVPVDLLVDPDTGDYQILIWTKKGIKAQSKILEQTREISHRYLEALAQGGAGQNTSAQGGTLAQSLPNGLRRSWGGGEVVHVDDAAIEDVVLSNYVYLLGGAPKVADKTSEFLRSQYENQVHRGPGQDKVYEDFVGLGAFYKDSGANVSPEGSLAATAATIVYWINDSQLKGHNVASNPKGIVTQEDIVKACRTKEDGERIFKELTDTGVLDEKGRVKRALDQKSIAIQGVIFGADDPTFNSVWAVLKQAETDYRVQIMAQWLAQKVADGRFGQGDELEPTRAAAIAYSALMRSGHEDAAKKALQFALGNMDSSTGLLFKDAKKNQLTANATLAWFEALGPEGTKNLLYGGSQESYVIAWNNFMVHFRVTIADEGNYHTKGLVMMDMLDKEGAQGRAKGLPEEGERIGYSEVTASTVGRLKEHRALLESLGQTLVADDIDALSQSLKRFQGQDSTGKTRPSIPYSTAPGHDSGLGYSNPKGIYSLGALAQMLLSAVGQDTHIIPVNPLQGILSKDGLAGAIPEMPKKPLDKDSRLPKYSVGEPARKQMLDRIFELTEMYNLQRRKRDHQLNPQNGGLDTVQEKRLRQLQAKYPNSHFEGGNLTNPHEAQVLDNGNEQRLWTIDSEPMIEKALQLAQRQADSAKRYGQILDGKADGVLFNEYQHINGRDLLGKPLLPEDASGGYYWSAEYKQKMLEAIGQLPDVIRGAVSDKKFVAIPLVLNLGHGDQKVMATIPFSPTKRIIDGTGTDHDIDVYQGVGGRRKIKITPREVVVPQYDEALGIESFHVKYPNPIPYGLQRPENLEEYVDKIQEAVDSGTLPIVGMGITYDQHFVDPYSQQAKDPDLVRARKLIIPLAQEPSLQSFGLHPQPIQDIDRYFITENQFNAYGHLQDSTKFNNDTPDQELLEGQSKTEALIKRLTASPKKGGLRFIYITPVANGDRDLARFHGYLPSIETNVLSGAKRIIVTDLLTGLEYKSITNSRGVYQETELLYDQQFLFGKKPYKTVTRGASGLQVKSTTTLHYDPDTEETLVKEEDRTSGKLVVSQKTFLPRGRNPVHTLTREENGATVESFSHYNRDETAGTVDTYRRIGSGKRLLLSHGEVRLENGAYLIDVDKYVDGKKIDVLEKTQDVYDATNGLLISRGVLNPWYAEHKEYEKLFLREFFPAYDHDGIQTDGGREYTYSPKYDRQNNHYDGTVVLGATSALDKPMYYYKDVSSVDSNGVQRTVKKYFTVKGDELNETNRADVVGRFINHGPVQLENLPSEYRVYNQRPLSYTEEQDDEGHFLRGQYVSQLEDRVVANLFKSQYEPNSFELSFNTTKTHSTIYGFAGDENNGKGQITGPVAIIERNTAITQVPDVFGHSGHAVMDTQRYTRRDYETGAFQSEYGVNAWQEENLVLDTKGAGTGYDDFGPDGKPTKEIKFRGKATVGTFDQPTRGIFYYDNQYRLMGREGKPVELSPTKKDLIGKASKVLDMDVNIPPDIAYELPNGKRLVSMEEDFVTNGVRYFVIDTAVNRAVIELNPLPSDEGRFVAQVVFYPFSSKSTLPLDRGLYKATLNTQGGTFVIDGIQEVIQTKNLISRMSIDAVMNQENITKAIGTSEATSNHREDTRKLFVNVVKAIAQELGVDDYRKLTFNMTKDAITGNGSHFFVRMDQDPVGRIILFVSSDFLPNLIVNMKFNGSSPEEAFQISQDGRIYELVAEKPQTGKSFLEEWEISQKFQQEQLPQAVALNERILTPVARYFLVDPVVGDDGTVVSKGHSGLVKTLVLKRFLTDNDPLSRDYVKFDRGGYRFIHYDESADMSILPLTVPQGEKAVAQVDGKPKVIRATQFLQRAANTSVYVYSVPYEYKDGFDYTAKNNIFIGYDFNSGLIWEHYLDDGIKVYSLDSFPIGSTRVTATPKEFQDVIDGRHPPLNEELYSLFKLKGLFGVVEKEDFEAKDAQDIKINPDDLFKTLEEKKYIQFIQQVAVVTDKARAIEKPEGLDLPKYTSEQKGKILDILQKPHNFLRIAEDIKTLTPNAEPQGRILDNNKIIGLYKDGDTYQLDVYDTGKEDQVKNSPAARLVPSIRSWLAPGYRKLANANTLIEGKGMDIPLQYKHILDLENAQKYPVWKEFVRKFYRLTSLFSIENSFLKDNSWADNLLAGLFYVGSGFSALWTYLGVMLFSKSKRKEHVRNTYFETLGKTLQKIIDSKPTQGGEMKVTGEELAKKLLILRQLQGQFVMGGNVRKEDKERYLKSYLTSSGFTEAESDVLREAFAKGKLPLLNNLDHEADDVIEAPDINKIKNGIEMFLIEQVNRGYPQAMVLKEIIDRQLLGDEKVVDILGEMRQEESNFSREASALEWTKLMQLALIKSENRVLKMLRNNDPEAIDALDNLLMTPEVRLLKTLLKKREKEGEEGEKTEEYLSKEKLIAFAQEYFNTPGVLGSFKDFVFELLKKKVIDPAITQVYKSTFAYAGDGKGINSERLAEVEQAITSELHRFLMLDPTSITAHEGPESAITFNPYPMMDLLEAKTIRQFVLLKFIQMAPSDTQGVSLGALATFDPLAMFVVGDAMRILDQPDQQGSPEENKKKKAEQVLKRIRSHADFWRSWYALNIWQPGWFPQNPFKFQGLFKLLTEPDTKTFPDMRQLKDIRQTDLFNDTDLYHLMMYLNQLNRDDKKGNEGYRVFATMARRILKGGFEPGETYKKRFSQMEQLLKDVNEGKKDTGLIDDEQFDELNKQSKQLLDDFLREKKNAEDHKSFAHAHNGTIEKDKISKVSSNGDTILNELIKEGILEGVSSTQVRLNGNLDQYEDKVRAIAKGDFDKIWAILRQSYHMGLMKFITDKVLTKTDIFKETMMVFLDKKASGVQWDRLTKRWRGWTHLWGVKIIVPLLMKVRTFWSVPEGWRTKTVWGFTGLGFVGGIVFAVMVPQWLGVGVFISVFSLGWPKMLLGKATDMGDRLFWIATYGLASAYQFGVLTHHLFGNLSTIHGSTFGFAMGVFLWSLMTIPTLLSTFHLFNALKSYISLYKRTWSKKFLKWIGLRSLIPWRGGDKGRAELYARILREAIDYQTRFKAVTPTGEPVQEFLIRQIRRCSVDRDDKVLYLFTPDEVEKWTHFIEKPEGPAPKLPVMQEAKEFLYRTFFSLIQKKPQTDTPAYLQATSSHVAVAGETTRYLFETRAPLGSLDQVETSKGKKSPTSLLAHLLTYQRGTGLDNIVEALKEEMKDKETEKLDKKIEVFIEKLKAITALESIPDLLKGLDKDQIWKIVRILESFLNEALPNNGAVIESQGRDITEMHIYMSRSFGDYAYAKAVSEISQQYPSLKAAKQAIEFKESKGEELTEEEKEFNKKYHAYAKLVLLKYRPIFSDWMLRQKVIKQGNEFVFKTAGNVFKPLVSTIAKAKFSEVSANGDAILNELIKGGILEVVSTTEVRLKGILDGDLDDKKDSIKEIAESDFDKIWGILQQSLFLDSNTLKELSPEQRSSVKKAYNKLQEIYKNGSVLEGRVTPYSADNPVVYARKILDIRKENIKEIIEAFDQLRDVKAGSIKTFIAAYEEFMNYIVGIAETDTMDVYLPFYKEDGGVVAKVKFSEVSANGDAILNELIKGGILEVVSSTEVRLKVNLDQNKGRIQEIAKDDFDKIWAILQQSQEYLIENPITGIKGGNIAANLWLGNARSSNYDAGVRAYPGQEAYRLSWATSVGHNPENVVVNPIMHIWGSSNDAFPVISHYAVAQHTWTSDTQRGRDGLLTFYGKGLVTPQAGDGVITPTAEDSAAFMIVQAFYPDVKSRHIDYFAFEWGRPTMMKIIYTTEQRYANNVSRLVMDRAIYPVFRNPQIPFNTKLTQLALFSHYLAIRFGLLLGIYLSAGSLFSPFANLTPVLIWTGIATVFITAVTAATVVRHLREEGNLWKAFFMTLRDILKTHSMFVGILPMLDKGAELASQELYKFVRTDKGVVFAVQSEDEHRKDLKLGHSLVDTSAKVGFWVTIVGICMTGLGLWVGLTTSWSAFILGAWIGPLVVLVGGHLVSRTKKDFPFYGLVGTLGLASWLGTLLFALPLGPFIYLPYLMFSIAALTGHKTYGVWWNPKTKKIEGFRGWRMFGKPLGIGIFGSLLMTRVLIGWSGPMGKSLIDWSDRTGRFLIDWSDYFMGNESLLTFLGVAIIGTGVWAFWNVIYEGYRAMGDIGKFYGRELKGSWNRLWNLIVSKFSKPPASRPSSTGPPGSPLVAPSGNDTQAATAPSVSSSAASFVNPPPAPALAEPDIPTAVVDRSRTLTFVSPSPTASKDNKAMAVAKRGGIDFGRTQVGIQSSGRGIQTAFDDPTILRLLLKSDGLAPIIYDVQEMTPSMVNHFVGLN